MMSRIALCLAISSNLAFLTRRSIDSINSLSPGLCGLLNRRLVVILDHHSRNFSLLILVRTYTLSSNFLTDSLILCVSFCYTNSHFYTKHTFTHFYTNSLKYLPRLGGFEEQVTDRDAGLSLNVPRHLGSM